MASDNVNRAIQLNSTFQTARDLNAGSNALERLRIKRDSVIATLDDTERYGYYSHIAARHLNISLETFDRQIEDAVGTDISAKLDHTFKTLHALSTISPVGALPNDFD